VQQRRRRGLVAVVGLLLALSAQSCIVVGPVVAAPILLFYSLTNDPAPTIDAAENKELLQDAQGSLVVADGAHGLRVVQLPGGAIHTLNLRGEIFVASGVDAQGRIALVRERWPWTLLLFAVGNTRYELAVVSLSTGKEQRLGDVRAGNDPKNCRFSMAGGRVAFQSGLGPAQVFELSSGAELDMQWCPETLNLLALSADGSTCLTVSYANSERRLLLLDLERRLVREPRPEEFIDQGGAWDLHEFSEQWAVDPAFATLPGYEHSFSKKLPGRLVIYEGLASIASHPRNHFGLRHPQYDRSIRLGSLDSGESVTLVPRFYAGTCAFSPNQVPQPLHSRGPEALRKP
jgi:hypothetical protein